MSYTPLVSIIVPIYNEESLLPNCIDSIINQSYSNLEIILVDDGSTDESKLICETFARTDKRIVVRHQENAGASSARNAGITAATGDFVQFADADDYLEPHMTKKLVDKMSTQTQLVLCGYSEISYQDNRFFTKQYVPKMTGSYNRTNFFRHIGYLYKDILLPSPCNKLYRMDLIRKHHIAFQSHLDMGEDLLFNLDYLHRCQRIHLIRKPLYNYAAVSAHSLSRCFQVDFFKNQQMLFQQMRYFLCAHRSYTGENKVMLQCAYANGIINAMGNLFHPDSHLSVLQKKVAITAMIDDEEVRQTLPYCKNNLQTKLVGSMLRYHFLFGIYTFFKTKQLVRQQMAPLFMVLKKLQER